MAVLIPRARRGGVEEHTGGGHRRDAISDGVVHLDEHADPVLREPGRNDISHSGRDRSRRRRRNCSVASRSAASSPGAGSGTTGTWSLRSNVGASTHSGGPSPSRGCRGAGGTGVPGAAGPRLSASRPRSGSGRPGRAGCCRRGWPGHRSLVPDLIGPQHELVFGGQPVHRHHPWSPASVGHQAGRGPGTSGPTGRGRSPLSSYPDRGSVGVRANRRRPGSARAVPSARWKGESCPRSVSWR
jgi:hypothetical protein